MTRHVVRFHVHGNPIPQGSKAINHTRGRAYIREDNPNLQPWRNAVAHAAHKAMNGNPPLAGPLFLEALFYFNRPKTHYRTGRHADQLKPAAPYWCVTRPDLDKLARAVADSITGIICRDDAQLAQIVASKLYGTPGAELAVTELNQ